MIASEHEANETEITVNREQCEAKWRRRNGMEYEQKGAAR